MAELRPHPLGALVRRMLREAQREAKVFDLRSAAATHIMIWIRDGVFGSDRVNYLNAGAHGHCTPSA